MEGEFFLNQQLVKLVFNHHYYMWENQIFHQQDGCPMGIQSSCPVSRVVMDDWHDKVKEVEVRMDTLATINPVGYEKLEIYLIEKYVDDVATALEALKRGTRWDPKLRILTWSQEWEEDDKGMDDDQRPLQMIIKMVEIKSL